MYIVFKFNGSFYQEKNMYTIMFKRKKNTICTLVGADGDGGRPGLWASAGPAMPAGDDLVRPTSR